MSNAHKKIHQACEIHGDMKIAWDWILSHTDKNKKVTHETDVSVEINRKIIIITKHFYLRFCDTFLTASALYYTKLKMT